MRAEAAVHERLKCRNLHNEGDLLRERKGAPWFRRSKKSGRQVSDGIFRTPSSSALQVRRRESKTERRTHAAAEVSPAADERICRADDRLVEEGCRPCDAGYERRTEDADEESDRIQAACGGDGAGQTRGNGSGDEECGHSVRINRLARILAGYPEIAPYT